MELDRFGTVASFSCTSPEPMPFDINPVGSVGSGVGVEPLCSGIHDRLRLRE